MKQCSYKILVTGGSGFLGSHISDALSAAGHKVTLFDLSSSPYLRHDQKMVIGDITNSEHVSTAVAGHDFIFHFAAKADLDDAKNKPKETMTINIGGTINILEAAVQHNIKRIIFASTIYVYSDKGSFYRISKHACEELIYEFKTKFALDYTILRFGTLYGTRSNNSNSLYRVLQNALKNKKIIHKGTGHEVREYIHVKDAADVSVKMLEDDYSNQAYTLTGHHRLKLSEVYDMVKEILGDDIEIVYETQLNTTSHYQNTPYSYLPKAGKKVVLNQYHDLGQGLIEVLSEIDNHNEEHLFS